MGKIIDCHVHVAAMTPGAWLHVGPIAENASLSLHALAAGVIAAHCGTRSAPFETDYFDEFVRLVHQYENLYGDTAALNLPMRTHAFDGIFKDDVVRSRIVHRSDWPVIAFPAPTRVGVSASVELMKEKNWMRRDMLIKQRFGFDEEYWQRAAKLLRIAD